MSACNVRQPTGVWRCERERGHAGQHETYTGVIEGWPNLSEPKAKAQRKRRRLPRTSQAQSDRTDALTGIMAERIYESMGIVGFFRCECPLADPKRRCRKEWTDPQKALDECDPHHLNRRRGKPGSRANFFSSDDAPVGIAVVSKVCHREIESSPKWKATG